MLDNIVDDDDKSDNIVRVKFLAVKMIKPKNFILFNLYFIAKLE